MCLSKGGWTLLQLECSRDRSCRMCHLLSRRLWTPSFLSACCCCTIHPHHRPPSSPHSVLSHNQLTRESKQPSVHSHASLLRYHSYHQHRCHRPHTFTLLPELLPSNRARLARNIDLVRYLIKDPAPPLQDASSPCHHLARGKPTCC